MIELKRFFRDPRFFIPAIFLLGFELFLQSGLYRYLLKPHTYAENVNRIATIVRSSPLRPDALIAGTSVAYQGINLPLLNKQMEGHSIRVQSIATEGAMIVTQNTLFQNLAPELKELKTVIHFVEATTPWTARYDLDPANRSMLAQFPPVSTLERIYNYRYKLESSDYSYFWIRSLTYQADIKDFTLDPTGRLKRLGRVFRDDTVHEYPYVNEQPFAMDVLNPTGLRECMKLAMKPGSDTDASGKVVTDSHHREAMYKTCQLGLWDPMDNIAAEQWQELFFHRLQIFYDEIYRSNRNLIIVFPPYSRLIQDHQKQKRDRVWEEALDRILKNRPYRKIDLRQSLDGPDNLSLYYDTIHLNEKGSIRFTKIFADALEKQAPFIKGTQAEETE